MEPVDPSAQAGLVAESMECVHDAVFGTIGDNGPNYRNVSPICLLTNNKLISIKVGWLGTSVLMMKTQIGLGVLSIPSAFDTLGIVPGVICLVAIGAITSWSGYIVGAFKLRHREIYSIDDVGYMIFGIPGRIILGGAFVLC